MEKSVNNKCKAFTSLEQSRKLAEILPLESADMHYNNASIKGINYVDEYRAELMDYNNAIKVLSKYTINPLFEVVPCWSASALLEIIRNNGRYEMQMYEGGFYFETSGFMTESYFSPIDTCYEFILKLHELNWL